MGSHVKIKYLNSSVCSIHAFILQQLVDKSSVFTAGSCRMQTAGRTNLRFNVMSH